MGNDLACPCTTKELDEIATPKEDLTENEILNFKVKLQSEDILYHYSYGLTKLNLIRTCDLEKFFSSKNLLKLNRKKYVINLINYIYRQMNILINFIFQIIWGIKIFLQ